MTMMKLKLCAFFSLLCAADLATPVQCLASTKSKGRRSKPSSTTSTSPGTGFGAASMTQPVFVHTPDTSPTTQKLIQFLQSQKAKGLDNVDVGVHQDTGVRGLFCRGNIKKGQLICQIPSDCALALSDPNLNGDDCPTVAHCGANLISMYLQPEKAREFWSPYLDTLPLNDEQRMNFDPTPNWLCDNDLELLEFPRLINAAKQRREQIQQVAAEKGLAEEELRFATLLVSSRAFELSLPGPPPEAKTTTPKGDDGGTGEEGEYEMPKYDKRGQIISTSQQNFIRVLVPFLDFANHSSDQANCKLTLVDPLKDDAWFALEATRPIAAGKELTISYGNGVESSVRLLLDYGFVPSSNRIDSLMLKKGGDDCIMSLDGWTTTLEEDRTMLQMAEDDPVLGKILRFRIRLKESYA